MTDTTIPARRAVPSLKVSSALKKATAAWQVRIDAATLALKEDLALQIRNRMEREKISQSDLARRMRSSRSVVHRLLYAGRADSGVTLGTLAKAAVALNSEVQVRLKALALTEVS